MMRNKMIRYCVQILAGFLLCGSLSGCKIEDEVLVFALEEETEANTATDTYIEESLVRFADEGSEAETLIYVYVCGAVISPGVVELPEKSRVCDALAAAGGFAPDAKEDYVNLAAKVKDGEKLYFPTITEVAVWEQESYLEQQGLVNINTADAVQLMTLPGIGESRAEDIIAYREKNGAFQAKEDLKNVPGIKENMYAKLEDKIVVE